MMTDIIIPYELSNKGYELKYALRSVEKHLSGVGKVIIVGDLPEWITGVEHIPFEQTRGNIQWKERNIYEKIVAGMEVASESFLFMNDDHFLLSDYEAGEFPSYYHQELSSSVSQRCGYYKETLQNTIDLAGSLAFDYDCHCPIVYNKDGFYRLAWIRWLKAHGYAIKSLYAHFNNLQGERVEDCKIREPLSFLTLLKMIEPRDWFSINERSLNDGMKTLLNHLYPNKSKYER